MLWDLLQKRIAADDAKNDWKAYEKEKPCRAKTRGESGGEADRFVEGSSVKKISGIAEAKVQKRKLWGSLTNSDPEKSCKAHPLIET